MLSLVEGDARHIPLPDESVQCCITSPPYWGLRDYGLATWEGGDTECDHKQPASRKAGSSIEGGKKTTGHEEEGYRVCCARCGAVRHDGGIGLERTPEEYVANIVEVFREVWRVLRPDGTLWLNMGDCYARTGGWASNDGLDGMKRGKSGRAKTNMQTGRNGQKRPDNLKEKDLVGIPWRVAFALQADGWYLRSDIIWHKPNPMPESVTDRPTKAYEHLFLLAKQARYYYDGEAIVEPSTGQRGPAANFRRETKEATVPGQGYHQHRHGRDSTSDNGSRNRRDVWTIPTEAYRGAHFATFPEALVEPCILAGTSAKGNCPECGAPWERLLQRQSFGKKDYEGKHLQTEANAAGRRMLAGVRGAREAGQDHDNPFPPAQTLGWRASCDHAAAPVPALVFDPFCGSGTVGAVARGLGRSFVGIDLSRPYLALAAERTGAITQGMVLTL